MQRSKRSSGKKGSLNYQVRIIGGQWKRSLLPVSAASDIRPTPNRVRETVFNWLYTLFSGAWKEMACLDLFAGTGSFGFEAASRGVLQVTMVESNRIAFGQLAATRDRLGAGSVVTLIQGDAFFASSQLLSQNRQFDVIFLDPPFESGLLSGILPLCAGLLKDKGVVYIESPVFLTEEFVAKSGIEGKKWHVIRQDRAGHVRYQLLQLSSLGSSEA